MKPQAAIAERIRAALEQALTPIALAVADESGLHAGHAGAREGGHFRVRIVSGRFRGVGPLARHRLVYEAVAPLLRSGVHALAIDARAPEEVT
ncbi:MAG: BolA family protein [Steroidobacteraceae bacterium]